MDLLPEPMLPVSYHRTTLGGNKAFHNFANDYSHISDPNLRRRLALSEIDKVPFGLYHVRAVAVAGVGFFLDSYDIFAISLITTFLGLTFWSGPPASAINGFGGNNGQLPTSVNQALKASTSAGIVIGQVVFGWLADVFGRRRMYGIELAIIILSTLSCALASPSQSMSSTGLLVFWRVMMGIGIGGDYPLSSVITSEFAPTRWRGAMMAAVFSMQGIGQFLAAVVALVVTAAFKDSFINIPNVGSCDYNCQIAADRAWRIVVGFGALPACFALYYRITIPETPRYTFDVAHDVEKADADIRAYMASEAEGEVDAVQQARMKKIAAPSLNIPSASWPDVLSYFGRWKNARPLLGTTLSWFFLDLAYYGLALNNTVVLAAIGYTSGSNLYSVLYNNSVGTIILACAGSLPGYWTAVFTIDTIGRKPLQVFGFAVLTVLFAVLGFDYHRLSEGAMLALYILAQFFFNWGPNTTTFVVPGECYPTRYRSTGHGVSAAAGKVGAIIAQVISIPLLNKDAPPNCTGNACSPWLDRLMQIFALFMLCGTAVSLLIPETKGVTLEELAGEPPTSYNAGRNGSIVPPGSSGPGALGGGSSSSSSAAWNPFRGGQPAGFVYPRLGTAGGGGGGRGGLKTGWHAARSPRMGIMSSPEMAAAAQTQQQQQKQQQRGRTPNGTDSPGGAGAPPADAHSAGGGGGNSRTNFSKKLFGPPPAAFRRERGTSNESGDYAFSSSTSSSTAGRIMGAVGDGEADGHGNVDVTANPASMLPGWGAGWGRIDRGGPAPLENIRLQDVGSLLK